MTSLNPEDIGTARSPGSWRSAPFEAIVMVSLLAVANWFFSKEDLGWQEMNPSPWMLLPLFLGGRYGVVLGLVGSAVAVSAILTLNRVVNKTDAISLMEGEPYFFLALLLTGAIASLIYTLVVGPVRQIRNRNDFLEEQSQRMEENLGLFRENEVALQQSLLLHGAEHTSLSGELHRLFTRDVESIDLGLLEWLQRLSGVESGAIYSRNTTSDDFLQVAVTGESVEWTFPETLGVDGKDFKIVELALTHREIATCRHLWEMGENGSLIEESPLLAAIATRDALSVLLIRRMAFEHIHWDSLGRVETLFHWVTSRRADALIGEEGAVVAEREILPPDRFIDRVELARRAGESLGLSSQLILFTPSGPNASECYESFLESLRAFATSADSLGAVQSAQGGYSIVLLTPLVGEAAATAAAQRVLSRTVDEGKEISFQIVAISNDAMLAELGLLSNESPLPDEPVMAEPSLIES